MEWRKDLGAVGLLGAAVTIFFWPVTVLEGAFFVQDVMVQNHPFRDFFARSLREGQLPLWNAAINCGFPLFAEGQAGPLYPPNVILALLLPTWAAINWNIVLHLWLAGAGMYVLVRAFGAVRPARTVRRALLCPERVHGRAGHVAQLYRLCALGCRCCFGSSIAS